MYMTIYELLVGLEHNVIPNTDIEVTSIGMRNYLPINDDVQYQFHLKSNVRQVDQDLILRPYRHMFEYLKNADDYDENIDKTIIAFKSFKLTGGNTEIDAPTVDITNPHENLLPAYVRHEFVVAGYKLNNLSRVNPLPGSIWGTINVVLNQLYVQRNALATIKHYFKIYKRSTINYKGCRLVYQLPDDAYVHYKTIPEKNYKVIGKVFLPEPIIVYVDDVDSFKSATNDVVNDDTMKNVMRRILIEIEKKLEKVRLDMDLTSVTFSNFTSSWEDVITIVGPEEINQPDQGIKWTK